MNFIHYNTVFCDWLDVTYSPDEDILSELVPFLVSSGFTLSASDSGKFLQYVPVDGSYGSLMITEKSGHVRVSASGGSISFLRSRGAFESYVVLLSTAPHNVTRLDLAYDLARDFPSVLITLRRAHKGISSFTRKQSPVRELLSLRPDGKRSGTYYIGPVRSKIKGRVYDKQLEMLEKRKMLTGVCTRYEITFKGGCSLKDALDCDSLFWLHSPVLKLGHLRPPGVPDWVDGSDFTGWDYQPPGKTTYESLDSRIQFSGCIDDLIILADTLGDHGRQVLLRLLTKRINS